MPKENDAQLMGTIITDVQPVSWDQMVQGFQKLGAINEQIVRQQARIRLLDNQNQSTERQSTQFGPNGEVIVRTKAKYRAGLISEHTARALRQIDRG
jgi:hypothetical protein